MKRALSVVLALFLVQAGCGEVRLRTPTPEEKREYLFSKNLDRALIDPNENGPLEVLPALAETEEDVSPFTFARRQHDLIKSEIMQAGYSDDEGGFNEFNNDEKGASVVIAVLIIVGVLAGAAVPLLYLLHVI